MDFKDILSKEFGRIILDANLKFIGTDKTLEIVVDSRNLEEVEKYTRQIYSYLETQDWFKTTWILEVLSKGSDTNIKIDELVDFIGKKVIINLRKPFDSQNSLVAEILEDNEDKILLKWNKKGQFKKIELEKENIIKICLYFK